MNASRAVPRVVEKPTVSSPDPGGPGGKFWLRQRSVPELFAMAGVFVYGVTYFGCALFYNPLGVEPSDVGLGYAELLAQAGVYVALYLGLLPALGLVPLLLLRRFAPLRTLGTDDPRQWRIVFSVFAVSLVLTVASVFVRLASTASSHVREGNDPPDLWGLLPWDDAEVASVQWLADKDADGSPLPRCVIRLGESQGAEILYDPNASAILQVPRASVLVIVRPEAKRC